MTENERPVKTVENAFAILERIKRDGGAGVSDLARELGLAKSTVHRHLRTLKEQGCVRRDGDEYCVALRFLDFGIHAREANDLYDVAKPKVDELAEETGEKVWCVVEEHGYSYHLYGASGKHSVLTGARTGQRGYLHQLAAGKAILAYLPDERVREIIERRGLSGQTDATITEEAALFVELEEIRERGFAFNREESIDGLHAVGAPVRDADGTPIGGISISGPANRLTGDRFDTELPGLLLGATNEIELNYTYSR